MVKLHSIIKHRILGYYFGTLRQFIKRFYSFYYVDLYSGSGDCQIDDQQVPPEIYKLLPEDFRHTWEAPFFSLIRNLDQDSSTLQCIFNDNNPECIKHLKQKLIPYMKYVLDVQCLDANDYYVRALALIGKPSKPSLIFLDPFKHSQLQFSTIENISKFKDEKTGRKPELIINLMAYSMLEAVVRHRPEDYDSIDIALGTSSWREKLEEYKSEGRTHELFRDIFKAKLESLGYYCTIYTIFSVNKSPQYYLFFCTFNPGVHEIHKKLQQKITDLQQEEWFRKIATVSWIADNVSTDQQSLSRYLS